MTLEEGKVRTTCIRRCG